MRYSEGDSVIVTFLDQTVYKCQIKALNDNYVELELKDKQNIDTELPQHITICSGLIKADKYEWMIQKQLKWAPMNLLQLVWTVQ